MVAMALVRFCSAVKSVTKAIRVLAIAPVPCSARPTTTPIADSDKAATTLPITKSARPPKITGLRPILSDNKPNGI